MVQRDVHIQEQLYKDIYKYIVLKIIVTQEDGRIHTTTVTTKTVATVDAPNVIVMVIFIVTVLGLDGP